MEALQKFSSLRVLWSTMHVIAALHTGEDHPYSCTHNTLSDAQPVHDWPTMPAAGAKAWGLC